MLVWSHFGHQKVKCAQNVPKLCPKPKYVQNVTKMCLKVTNVPKMHPNLALSFGTLWTCLWKMTKVILYVQNVTIMHPKIFCLISISLELPQCAQNMSKYLDTFWSYFGTVYKKWVLQYNSCKQVWPDYVCCDQLVQGVTSWCKVWQAGARCDEVWPGVINCCYDCDHSCVRLINCDELKLNWLSVARCDWLVTYRWDKVVKDVTSCHVSRCV